MLSSWLLKVTLKIGINVSLASAQDHFCVSEHEGRYHFRSLEIRGLRPDYNVIAL